MFFAQNPLRQQFDKLTADASDCLINKVPTTAFERYFKALQLVHNSYAELGFRGELARNSVVVVVKYLFSVACIQRKTYDQIIMGMEKLSEIETLHKPVGDCASRCWVFQPKQSFL